MEKMRAKREGGRIGGLQKEVLINGLLYFIACFILSSSQMAPGLTPFALALAASKKDRPGAYPAFGGAFLGYILIWGTGGMAYIAATILTFSCSVLLKKVRLYGSAVFMPMVTGLCLFISRFPGALIQGGMGMLLLVCEVIVCTSCVSLFSKIKRDEKALLSTVGKCVLIVALLLALEPLRLFGLISVSRVCACMMVMVFSWRGGASFGAGAGVLAGAAFDLSSVISPFFAGVYGFAGLLSGFAARGQGRLFFTVCYIFSNAAATLWGFDDVRARAALYECFIASAFFIVLPEKVLRFVVLDAKRNEGEREVRAPESQNLAMKKLRAVSSAIGELSKTMGDLKEGLKKANDEDISTVFDRASDRTCRTCQASPNCWDRDYVSTFGALNDVTSTLAEKGELETEDFPIYFSSRCLRFASFCGAVNEEYSSLLRRKAAHKREDEARRLMETQYEGLQGVLSDIEDSLSTYPEYYPQMEEQIKGIAQAYSKTAKASVYSENGRMHVEIKNPGQGAALPDRDAFAKSVSKALGREFMPPEETVTKQGGRLLLLERERYGASVCCAIRKKQGEDVCGDSSMHFRTDDGRAAILLSDGMGSGVYAARLSQNALSLIARFIRSGCSIQESVKAVMPVLTARFEKQGFVTLDLLEINLFTGDSRMIKYGAAASYVVRKGKVRRIESASMPAGTPQINEEVCEPALFKLRDGDRIVMLSDGVFDSTEREFLEDALAQDTEPNKLASSIIDHASRFGATDDMTVVIISLCER